MLDTGDGVAITFLSDIEQALTVALKLQLYLYAPAPRPAFQARIGSFGAPGHVLVSGPYYDTMSRLKPE